MSNDEYKVKAVLKIKLIRSKPYYLIKWLGYDDLENSWEPEINLSPAILTELRKNHLEWFIKTIGYPAIRR